ALHGGSDLSNRAPLALGGDREAGLDHVDPEPRELLGDLDLLRARQRDARRLLAVAKRRVEEPDYVGVRHGNHRRAAPVSATASSSGGPSRLPRPIARAPTREALRTSGSPRAPRAPTPSRTRR